MDYLINEVENKTNYFEGCDRLIITGNRQGRAYNVWGDDGKYDKYYGILFGNEKFPSLKERLGKYDGNVAQMVMKEFGEKGDPRRIKTWENALGLLFNGETDNDMYEGITNIFEMVFGGNWEFGKYYAWDTNDWEYFIYDRYIYSLEDIREIAGEYFYDFKEYNVYDFSGVESLSSFPLGEKSLMDTIHVYPWENCIEKIKSHMDFNCAEDRLFVEREVIAYKIDEI